MLVYSRKYLKDISKRNIEGKIWRLLLCFLIMCLCTLALNVPIVGFAAIVFYPAISYGYLYVYLKVTAGEEFSPADLFFAFQNGSVLSKVIATYFLTALFTFLWSLLFIIPGIVKSYSYSMAPMIIIENPEKSAFDAINESKKMMDGRKWDLFVIQLSFFGWSLLCTITFGLASIYVIPYYMATYVNFYRFLKSQDSARCEQYGRDYSSDFYGDNNGGTENPYNL